MERVGDVLGRIQTLLIDIDPVRVAFTTREHLAEIRNERWLPLRDQLEVVRVKEPSTDMRETMRELEVAIENVFHKLFQLGGMTGSSGDAKEVQARHAGANTLVAAILDSLHNHQ
jgi:hypothetical protein